MCYAGADIFVASKFQAPEPSVVAESANETNETARAKLVSGNIQAGEPWTIGRNSDCRNTEGKTVSAAGSFATNHRCQSLHALIAKLVSSQEQYLKWHLRHSLCQYKTCTRRYFVLLQRQKPQRRMRIPNACHLICQEPADHVSGTKVFQPRAAQVQRVKVAARSSDANQRDCTLHPRVPQIQSYECFRGSRPRAFQ